MSINVHRVSLLVGFLSVCPHTILAQWGFKTPTPTRIRTVTPVPVEPTVPVYTPIPIVTKTVPPTPTGLVVGVYPLQGPSRIYIEDKQLDGTWKRRDLGIEVDAPLDRSCVIDVTSPCFMVIKKIPAGPTPVPTPNNLNARFKRT